MNEKMKKAYQYVAVTIGTYGTDKRFWYIKRCYIITAEETPFVYTIVLRPGYNTREVAEKYAVKISRQDKVSYIPDVYRGNILDKIAPEKARKGKKNVVSRTSRQSTKRGKDKKPEDRNCHPRKSGGHTRRKIPRTKNNPHKG